MSFLRHEEIYPCDEGTISRPCPRSSPWMSLQLAIPGRLLSSRARFRFTSRSYTANHQPRPTMLRQRTAKCRLTDCLSRGVQSSIRILNQCLQGLLRLSQVSACRWNSTEHARCRETSQDVLSGAPPSTRREAHRMPSRNPATSAARRGCL
jgi:hypothetical protein